jgi:hypothetical protein
VKLLRHNTIWAHQDACNNCGTGFQIGLEDLRRATSCREDTGFEDAVCWTCQMCQQPNWSNILIVPESFRPMVMRTTTR